MPFALKFEYSTNCYVYLISIFSEISGGETGKYPANKKLPK